VKKTYEKKTTYDATKENEVSSERGGPSRKNEEPKEKKKNSFLIVLGPIVGRGKGQASKRRLLQNGVTGEVRGKARRETGWLHV